MRQSFGKKLRLKNEPHFALQQSRSVSQRERKNLQASPVGGDGDMIGDLGDSPVGGMGDMTGFKGD
jgi:hypothetical protein